MRGECVPIQAEIHLFVYFTNFIVKITNREVWVMNSYSKKMRRKIQMETEHGTGARSSTWSLNEMSESIVSQTARQHLENPKKWCGDWSELARKN